MRKSTDHKCQTQFFYKSISKHSVNEIDQNPIISLCHKYKNPKKRVSSTVTNIHLLYTWKQK